MSPRDVIAREYVYWFSTIWIATDRRMPLDHSWLVRVGDQCAARVLQRFKVGKRKLPPVREFTRGPAIAYNRWMNEAQGILALNSDLPLSSAANAEVSTQ